MWKTKFYVHPKLFMKNILIIAILFLGQNALGQKSDDIQLANEYFINGDFEKAQDLYSSLADNPKNISIIHNNYLKLLFDLEEYKDAEKYLKRITKIFPKNVYYQIDKGFLLRQLGKEAEADKLFNNIIDKNKGNQYLIRQVSQYFINKRF